MTGDAWWAIGFLAVGSTWAVIARQRRKHSTSPDGDWGVLTRCERCGETVPRWFLLDKATPRGSYSLYRYPIPTSCRVCRHASGGVAPLAWQSGESEWQYDERFARHVAALVSAQAR